MVDLISVLREAFRKLGLEYGIVYAVLYGSRALGVVRGVPSSYRSIVDILHRHGALSDVLTSQFRVGRIKERAGPRLRRGQ